MNEQVTGKIMEYVDQIAQALGVAAEFVFTALVKQIFIEGVVYATLGVLLPIVGFSLLFVALNKVKKSINENGYFDSDDVFAIVWTILSVAFGIISVVGVINFFADVPDQFMKIFNPEYYVLERITELLKGGGE